MNQIERSISNLLENNLANISAEQSDLDILRDVYDFASKNSTDPRTQTAAILRTSKGIEFKEANRISQQMNFLTPEEVSNIINSDLKYEAQLHNEKGVILQVAKSTTATTIGSKLYTNMIPCLSCTSHIIEAEISELCIHFESAIKTSEKWLEPSIRSLEYISRSKVRLTFIKGNVGNCTNLKSGEVWRP